MFANTEYLSIQKPLLMVASMLTGKDVEEILAMEIHERAKLLNNVAVQIQELTQAVADGTDPAGEGGVTLSEDEVQRIIDEANDVPEAVARLTEYKAGAE